MIDLSVHHMIIVSNYLAEILVPKVFLYDKTQGKAFKMTTLGREGLLLWCNAMQQY